MNMTYFFKLVAVLHIFSGAVSILSFWFIALSRKGNSRHILIGKLFVISMYIIGITSLIMSALVVLAPLEIHPQTQREESLIFTLILSYLGITSMITARNGMIHVDHKNKRTNLDTSTHLILNWIALILGFCVLLYGIYAQSILFAALSTVGISIGYGYLSNLKKKESWIKNHISSMGGAGIASHTALIAGGGARYMPELIRLLGIWGWILPSIVGSALIGFWIKKYDKTL